MLSEFSFYLCGFAVGWVEWSEPTPQSPPGRGLWGGFILAHPMLGTDT